QTPGVFAKIAFLGASAEGASTFTLQLNFSDGTSTSQSFSVPDWYWGSNYAIKSIGRVTRIDDGDDMGPDEFSGNSDNPRLYDNVITLGSPYNTKILNSIQFTKSSTVGRTAILAICGVTAVGAPAAPVATSATNITYTGFSANWNAAATATGYYLDVSTSPTFTTNITGYNNLSVGSVLTYSVTGLTAGTIYYYRVRAINASGTSASSNTITVGNLVGKYVTSTGAGTFSGDSWANAIAGSLDRDANGTIDLQDAINNSSNTCIWVGAGTYKPTTGTDRTKSFTLKSSVQIFGGFIGTETISSQRNLSSNSSILSGDIGTVGVNTDNSLHVISIYGTTVNNTALLDGFTISNGYNADQTSSGYPFWWGAGILQANNNMVVDISPVYRNCKIIGNHSYGQGAAICNINSWTVGCTVSPQFINCVISGNKSEANMIVNNSCYSGGTSNISYTNCTFSGNYGKYNIINNSISSGGVTMSNCIVYTNHISSKNDYISGGTITYSDIEGGFSGTGNINSNPLFITPIDPLTAPTTSGDLHISTSSPCYNSGTTSGAPSTDIEGTIRTSTTDMGAFENQNLLPIELMSFEANCINEIANLSWKTASETNNDYFTIEKSTNGETWEFVTKMKGAGNSNSNLEYYFNDNYPFNENSYYRLKQTDFDGRFTFSDIINYRGCQQKNDFILVYPNPTKDLINIVSKNNEILNSIEIISISGQVVYSEKVDAESTIINTSNLSIGLYYLLSNTPTNVYVNKIEIRH
ncbi:MAG: T9SS type A sorting domain-containing protein, partial [Bacteroidetes bacterium]|nr:T9SS type A sorting domain-containing protein [Bacteroidota bacterium]